MGSFHLIFLLIKSVDHPKKVQKWITMSNSNDYTAKQLLLMLSVFAFSNYGLAKPSEGAFIRLDINVNIDQEVDGGPLHKAILVHKEDGNGRALKGNDEEEGRSKDRYRSLVRSYAIDSGMWETHDYGKVCSDCAMEHSRNIVQCTKKLRSEEEYKECFQKILEKDENGPDYEKCATCICKQLRINMRLDVEDYPDLKNMFCFLANKYEDCREKETQETEHFPPCKKGLTCDVIGPGKDYGICVEDWRLEIGDSTMTRERGGTGLH